MALFCRFQHYIPYFCFVQTIFSRLYKAGSSFQGGTLLQLRNLINRRNVFANRTGRFIEIIDFFQLVIVECHIMAAAMHFFSIRNLQDAPETNALPSIMGTNLKPAEKWKILKRSYHQAY